MSVRGWAPGKEVLEPRGMWSVLAQKRKGSPQRASFAQNSRVSPGVTASRPGTSAVLATDGKVTGLFNWITPSGGNVVLFLDQGTLKSLVQGSSPTALLSGLSTTRAPSFADLDVWTYICGYDTNGNGTIECRIFDGTNLDTAFRGPITVSAASAVDAGTGYCTAGTHYIGFVYQNRSGFAGVPTTTVGAAITEPATSTYPSLSVPTFTPSVGTGSGQLRGSYDHPSSNHLTVSGIVNFAGWISGDSNHIVACLLYIDGHYCGRSTYGGARPDVAALHASPDNPNVGFNFFFDTSQLAAGEHTWYEVGIFDDGRTWQSNPLAFTIPTIENEIFVTLEAGLRKINISVTLPPQPDGGGNATLFLIMTRADNPSEWYWMSSDTQTGAIGEQPVPFNTAATLTFVASLSDEDMAASLDPANPQFLWLTQDANGNGPFNPTFVNAYGERMLYGDGTYVYASEINNPQQITGDQHVVTPPNQRKVAFAFPLPGSTDLFLTGERWTSRTTDNSDVPATWAQPIKVSDSLGAPFPSCVCARTGGGYAWIVTEPGVYLFDGSFGDKPVTYLVADQWARVNWKAAYAIEIADDVNGLRLYVAVPLDGATEPNALFCIDYQNGKTFDQVDISLDVLTPASFSSIAIIKEVATNLSNLWIGPAAAGHIAHLDPSTPNDQGNPVHWIWESGLVREKSDGVSRMIRVGNLDVWIRGEGTLLTTVYGPDKVQSVTPQLLSASGVPATLSPEPGIMYQEKFDLSKVENYSVRLEVNAVDSWAELSGFTGYTKQDLFNR